MLGALSYLLVTGWKNRIKSIIKSPVKLIYAIILIGIVVLTFFGGNMGEKDPSEYRELTELYAGCFAFYLIMFAMIAKNGFSKGAAMFTLSDANLLFPSPMSSVKILFYGLFKQLGSSLLLGFFLLFQYSWMHNLYGVSYIVLVYILIGYALTLFQAQLLAMVIYSFTNGNQEKKRNAQAAFYGVLVIFAAILFYFVLQDGGSLTSGLVKVINYKGVGYFPVAGWMTMFVFGLTSLNPINVLLGLLLSCIYVTALFITITYSKKEYYEDVLNTAQMNHSAITAQKEGRLEAVPDNVKVGKTGLGTGEGANAFYYKHLIENRRSRLFIIDRFTLVFTVMIIGFAFFMRNVGIESVFIFATYMQMFSTSLGRLTKELYKPYIYLVPEPAFKKLLYALKESLSSSIAEAVVIFVPVAFLLHVPAVETVFCILARLSFAFLFTAVNILSQRVFGSVISKALGMLFYLICLVILAAPGVVLAVLLTVSGAVIVSENITVFLSLIICNLPISLLVLYLCRNMLEYAELNYQ